MMNLLVQQGGKLNCSVAKGRRRIAANYLIKMADDDQSIVVAFQAITFVVSFLQVGFMLYKKNFEKKSLRQLITWEMIYVRNIIIFIDNM